MVAQIRNHIGTVIN